MAERVAELEPDAEVGRMVKRMPEGYALGHEWSARQDGTGPFSVAWEITDSAEPQRYVEAETPADALRAAGLGKEEGQGE